MADNITKKEHGGARLGAGRPRAKEQSRLYTFRVSGEMARFIDDHESKTEFIKKCIAQEMAGAEQESSDLEQGDAGLGQEPSGLEQERSVFEQTSLSKLGAVYPATMVKNMNINVFDIGIVAGFPVPLDNDADYARDMQDRYSNRHANSLKSLFSLNKVKASLS